MPTPFDSSPTIAVPLASHDYRIDALVEWDSWWVRKWGGPVGTGAVITYSFPQPGSLWGPPYGSSTDEPYNGLQYFDASEQAAARTALHAWADVANITFVEVPDNANSVGDIRFARTTAISSSNAAHAYTPFSQPTSGDVWLRSDVLPGPDLSSPQGVRLLLHEIGHALGLNHPFDGPVVLPAAEDNYGYTVMSYTPSSTFPVVPSPYDVLAITYLYGARGSTGPGLAGDYFMWGSNAGDVLAGTGGNDTLEAFSGNDTLWGGGGADWLDGGEGVDIAVFSATRNASVLTGTGTPTRVSGPEGVDHLVGVERLYFADAKLAFDLAPGNPAGNSVRLIGAAFDRQYIPEYAGVGITLFDAGLSIVQVAERALGTDLFLSLAGSHGNVDFVNTVFRNVVGRLPSPPERDAYVGMLQGSGGSMTQAELLAIAANSDLNATNINLAGLQQTGVEFF